MLRRAIAAAVCLSLAAQPVLAVNVSLPSIKLVGAPLHGVSVPTLPGPNLLALTPPVVPNYPLVPEPVDNSAGPKPVEAFVERWNEALKPEAPQAQREAFWPRMLAEKRADRPEPQSPAPVEPSASAPQTPAPSGLVPQAKDAATRVRKTGRRFVSSLLFGDPAVRPFLKRVNRRMAMGSALMILVGVGGTIESWLNGKLVDAAVARDGHHVALLLGAYLAAHMVFTFTDVFQQKVMAKVRLDLIQDVRVKLYKGFLERPSAFFDKHRPAELMARLINDVGMIPNRNINSRAALPYFLAMVAINGAMIFKTPVLGWAAAVLVPVMVALSIRYGRRRAKLEQAFAAERANLSKATETGLSAEREIKRLDAVTAQTSLYRGWVDRLQVAGYKITVLQLNNDYGIGFLSHFVTHFLVLGLGFWAWLAHGTPSVGEVLALAGYAGAFRGALQGLINVLYTDNKAAEGMTRAVLDYLGETPEARPAPLDAKLEPGTHGAVRAQLPVGKLGTLLARPGVAVLDGESRLLPGTLRDNLRYGAPQAGDAELLAALSAVGVDLSIVPGGLEADADAARTALGPGGERLVAVARALLSKPSLVVLENADDGLAGPDLPRLDAALERLFAGRTVLWAWPPERWEGRLTDVTTSLQPRL